MGNSVDWSKRGAYIVRKHDTTPREANEALTDPDAVVIDPDYASKSGKTKRTIGYSTTAGALLSVLTLDDGQGTTYGVNAWPSNSRDQRIYREGSET